LLINNELVQVLEFVLVAVLGFMPLTVIHWADRRPLLRLPLRARLGGHAVAARAAPAAAGAPRRSCGRRARGAARAGERLRGVGAFVGDC